MATDTTPGPDDQDVVPELKKYSVNLTLGDLFTTLSERPRVIVQAAQADQGTTTAQPTLLPSLHPDVMQHLQRISELADELRAEITLINQIDPDALNRLKQG